MLERILQKESLMFIIRDWFRDDEETEDAYPYGFGGGSKYFEESLNPPKAKQAEEHKMMSEYLKSTFGTIPCCLLPYPGEAVRKSNVRNEKGEAVILFYLAFAVRQIIFNIFPFYAWLLLLTVDALNLKFKPKGVFRHNPTATFIGFGVEKIKFYVL